MSALQSLPITEMLQRGSIKDVDVLRLKAALHTDCAISADEAELNVNRRARSAKMRVLQK